MLDIRKLPIVKDDVIKNVGPCSHLEWCSSVRPGAVDDLCGHWDKISIHSVERMVCDRKICWLDLVRYWRNL